MKKIFTTTLLVLITLTSFATTKKIAYVSTATPKVNGDSLIRKELAKTYTIVDVNAATQDTATVRAACQADSIDMVLVAEPLSSTATGILGIQGVKKPVLNMKVFAYKKAAAAWSWSSSTLWGEDAAALTMTIASGESSHAIFTGLTSPISIISQVGTSKGIDYANITQSLLTAGTLTQLSTITGGTNTCILEIAAGSTMLNVTTSKSFSFPKTYIQFGINTLSQGYLTSDGLKLLVNICNYLTTSTPTNIKTVSSESAFKVISSAGSLSVQVPASGTVKVISISGALVAQKVVSSEASFSLPQGTYVVQYISESTTTAKTVIVK
ncbi:MAG: T9SS type A sorting domain-containing protein [Paludibacteraceae bacterium]|nr:T9SS type A sorting domain-containing protein [Paludibacteraceae bacterium]